MLINILEGILPMGQINKPVISYWVSACLSFVLGLVVHIFLSKIKLMTKTILTRSGEIHTNSDLTEILLTET